MLRKHTECLVLWVIVVYFDGFLVSRTWFWMNVALLWDTSCAVNWSLLFMRNCDFHAVQPPLAMCHGISFLINFPFRHDSGPALEAQYRWEGQGRRRLPGTNSPGMFLWGASRPSFLVGQVSWCPALRRMTLLSLRSSGWKVVFWLNNVLFRNFQGERLCFD